MKKIIIINCGGNVLSLVRAINLHGYDPLITNDINEIGNATHIFLPGVGAFQNAMKKLEESNLINFLREIDYKKKNLMGICLGMQILLSEGYEEGNCEGLNLIKGKVKKIDLSGIKNNIHKIPNIGWHQLTNNIRNQKDTIIMDENIKKNCYFVHSYYAELENDQECISYINYGSLKIPAVIKKDKIYGCQFHPEKSRSDGLTLIENFLKLE